MTVIHNHPSTLNCLKLQHTNIFVPAFYLARCWFQEYVPIPTSTIHYTWLDGKANHHTPIYLYLSIQLTIHTQNSTTVYLNHSACHVNRACPWGDLSIFIYFFIVKFVLHSCEAASWSRFTDPTWPLIISLVQFLVSVLGQLYCLLCAHDICGNIRHFCTASTELGLQTLPWVSVSTPAAAAATVQNQRNRLHTWLGSWWQRLLTYASFIK